MRISRTLLAILMLVAFATTAAAYPSLFTSRCASCHSDDTPTCNGCHEHRGTLGATANSGAYAPGDPLTVTLTGGHEYGWIRAILYDDANMVQAIASGPTGTGDDGGTGDVVFPATLNATAPAAAGTYVWQAAWFGGNTNGIGHLESRRNVTIFVDDTNTSIPELPDGNNNWSSIKALY